MIELKSGVPLVRALDRGLALLSAFTAERPEQSLGDLVRAVSLDKGTTRRLLQTLVSSRYVIYDPVTERYALGGRILGLVSAVQAGGDLRSFGQSTLIDIAARTGASSFLWMHEDGMALCLGRVIVKPADIEAVWFSVGGRTSLNSGAGPRVLLAFVDETARQYALTLPLASRTPCAETDPKRLLKQASRIKQKGWDFAQDDFVVGMSGLGVPIRGPDGQLFGALSISTLTTRFGEPDHPDHLDALREAADMISRKMSSNKHVD